MKYIQVLFFIFLIIPTVDLYLEGKTTLAFLCTAAGLFAALLGTHLRAIQFLLSIKLGDELTKKVLDSLDEED